MAGDWSMALASYSLRVAGFDEPVDYSFIFSSAHLISLVADRCYVTGAFTGNISWYITTDS